MKQLGNPPVRYHVDASRRNVYAVCEDGSYRWLAITPDELERQMAAALQRGPEPEPDLDKPQVGSTIRTR